MTEDALNKITGPNLLIPLVQIIAVVAIGLIGWLLFTTYGQTEDLSEIKVKTDIYFSKIDDNTISIEQNTASIDKLSNNFDEFKVATIAWQTNADKKFDAITNGINYILLKLEENDKENNHNSDESASSAAPVQVE